MKSLPRILIAVAAAGALSIPLALADKWEPNHFLSNERYEYQVKTKQGDAFVESGYVMEIRPSDRKTGEGEEMVQVSYTTRHLVSKSELGQGTALGSIAAAGWMSAFVANPWYAMVFQQLELTVGEKMSLFGAGTVKVIGKETIAGREGFVCQFFQPNEEKKDVLAFEWVVDPKLAMPLRSRTYDNGELSSEMTLTAYAGQ